MEKKFILSLCGTSVLTNNSKPENRALLNQFANVSDPGNIPEDTLKVFEEVINDRLDQLLNTPFERASHFSAELNALTKLYDNQARKGRADYHLLICTDTWVGRQAAEIVKSYLENCDLSVQIHQQPDLKTDDIASFQLSLSDMVKYISGQCRGYSNAGYRIVFNLTGGFKSVQGFMQTLAMIYADESVYVFESGDDLLRIPRLPVQMAANDELRRYLRVFRRLAMNLPVGGEEISRISNVFYIGLDQEYGFSAWGEIVWDQHKKVIYSEELWPSPSDKLVFGPDFPKSVQKLPGHRLAEVNTKIDMLSRFLEKGSEYNLQGLDFKALSGNPVPGSSHELDAWHDQDAKRIFGHYRDGHDVFVLDRLDDALH